MSVYIPPALRGIAGQQSEAQSRSNERVWRIKLEFSAGGPFDTSECPETLLPLVESDQTPEVTVRLFELPSEASTDELRDILTWFRKASSATSEHYPHGDTRCQLLFPPSLSKETRKLLHHMAQGMQLPTFSKGLGEERRLTVHGLGFRDTPEMEVEVGAAAARRRVPGSIRERARQIWKWCQADGGSLWNLSLGEMEEALGADPDEAALPPAVKDLLERREHGTALIAAIRANDTAAALVVLREHPRAAWIRDEGGAGSGGGGGGGSGSQQPADSGHYPLHLAALAGMGEVVEALAMIPGAVDQRDRNYATPLKLAKKAGQTAMVDILLRHGAKDYEISQAAHKTAPVGIPVPVPGANNPARRLSLGGKDSHGHSRGGSPHVGSPATTAASASGASGSSPHAAGTYMAAHAAGRQHRMSSDASGPGMHRGGQHGGQGGGSGAGGGGGGQHGQHGHGHHGPSGLGSGQRTGAHGAGSGQGSAAGHGHGHAGGSGGGGRRSLDEHHHPHSQPQGATAGAAGASATDPTINPFAVLASADKSGGSSRRSSAGGVLPPRPPTATAADANGAAAASDSDSSIGALSRVANRARVTGASCSLPPIQSGEVSESSVAAALASLGLSAKPGLPTATEGSEGAGGSVSDDDDAGSAAGGGDDGGQKKRKTRRRRRSRGNRRQSNASTDEPVAAGEVGVEVAAAAGSAGSGGAVDSAPVCQSGAELLNDFTSGLRGGGGGGGGGRVSASAGGESSAHSESNESEGSAGGGSGSRPRRGGQQARARHHERRRAARVSGADGADRSNDNNNSNNNNHRNRRISGAEYSSFHQGHAYGHGHGGRGPHGGGVGGHYHVYGSGHHGHADDAASWRREAPATPTAAPAPPAAVATAGCASQSPARGGSGGGHAADEPRAPTSAGRPPAPRRTSAGPGAPLPPPSGAAAIAASAATTPGEAPGSPYHHGVHAPREHVAVGPIAGLGFAFGRGRGRGPPSAPGSPMRAAGPGCTTLAAPGSGGGAATAAVMADATSDVRAGAGAGTLAGAGDEAGAGAVAGAGAGVGQ